MKLAFVGAHGTGKTTLVNAIKEESNLRGMDCTIVQEAPRSLCRYANDPAYFHRGKNTVLKQMLLLIVQPIYENIAEKSQSLALCDRTVIDYWSYTWNLFKEELYDKNYVAFLKESLKIHSDSYDFIFYLPIEFPLCGDGVRENDKEFQAVIDNEIKNTLGEFNLRYSPVAGSVWERVFYVMNTIDKYKGTAR